MKKSPSLLKIASITGILLGAFALSAAAASWTAAPCTAPGCNTDAPLNVGGTPQAKSGKVGILNSLKLGGTTANPYASTGYMLDVVGNGLFSGLNVSGKIFTNELAVMGGDTAVGNILVSDGDGLAVWTDPATLDPTGGGLKVAGGGYFGYTFAEGGNAEHYEFKTQNMGSDWNAIMFNGSYNSGDGASAGGFIYRLGTVVTAVFTSGTGVQGSFTVGTTKQCHAYSIGTTPARYSICAYFQGTDLMVDAYSQINLTYLKLR